MEKFKELLRLLDIQGAIDVVQIHIKKLKVVIFVGGYYSFESKTYSLQLQATIDNKN